jgi:hypothetical protein
MRRLTLLISAMLALAAFATASALAASPHFIGTPTLTKTASGDLVVTGKAAGLGNTTVSAFLTADSVTQEVVCVNKGGNIAPGQGTSTTSVQGPTQNITPRNGQITFRVTLQAPALPTAAEAGCPNGNWTVRRLSLTYTNVVLHIAQDGSDLTFNFGTVDP